MTELDGSRDVTLRVMMATPKIAEAAVQFAETLGQPIADVLLMVAEQSIPTGERAGFMRSAWQWIYDNQKHYPIYIEDPSRYDFCESVTGKVFWRKLK